MLEQIAWETKSQPVESDDEAIDAGLASYNESAAELRDVRPLRCYARLASGALVGGAIARSWGSCCSLDELWVDEAFRRKGIGRRLIELVHVEAASRGCTLLYLETFSFQTPELYERLGYEIACQFDGFPNGIVKYIMHRRLSAA
jgi:GNAT superfamily N-acetyltransferase